MSTSLPVFSSNAWKSAIEPLATDLASCPVPVTALAPFKILPPVNQPVKNCEIPLVRLPATVSGSLSKSGKVSLLAITPFSCASSYESNSGFKSAKLNFPSPSPKPTPYKPVFSPKVSPNCSTKPIVD